MPGGTIGLRRRASRSPRFPGFLDLRHEEIMVRRQVERQRQRNVETNFLPGHRTFAARGLIWNWVDPQRTELFAVNDVLSTVVKKLRFPAPADRVSKVTSEGELTRVGTFPDGGSAESLGKIR